MPVSTMQIRYVNEPKPGKKMGSIKGTLDGVENETIFVWPDKLGQFSPGQTCTVEWNQSGEYRQFVKQRADSAAPPRVDRDYAQPATGEGVKYSIGPAKHYQQPNPTDQSRHIFVTGIVGRAMGSGKYQIADIRTLTKEANQTYDEVFLGKLADDSLPDFA